MYTLPSKTKHNYINYFDYVLKLKEQEDCFDAELTYTPVGIVSKNISFSLKKDGKEYLFSDFSNIIKHNGYSSSQSATSLSVSMSDEIQR